MTMRSILRPVRGSDLETSVSTTHAVVGALQKDELRIYCDTQCYVKFGTDNTVEATTSDYDISIPASLVVDVMTGGATYMSIISTGSDTAYINEWTAKGL